MAVLHNARLSVMLLKFRMTNTSRLIVTIIAMACVDTIFHAASFYIDCNKKYVGCALDYITSVLRLIYLLIAFPNASPLVTSIRVHLPVIAAMSSSFLCQLS
jgi:hypothetical protein